MATNIGAIEAVLGMNTAGFDAGTRKAGGSVDALERKLTSLGRGLLAIAGVGGLGAVARSAVQAGAELDGLERGLTAVMGSASAAEKQLSILAEVAKMPGLGFKEAIQGATRLQAVGFSAQESTRILKAFGNAIALVGGGKAELDRVTLALGQMAGKAKGFGQDIRQLIEASPAIASALRSAFGTLDSEKIQEIAGSGQEVINRLLPALEKLGVVSGGAKVALENLGDASFRVRAELGKRFLETMAPTIDKLTEAALKFIENEKAINGLATGLAGVTNALLLMLSPLTKAIEGFGLLIDRIHAWKVENEDKRGLTWMPGSIKNFFTGDQSSWRPPAFDDKTSAFLDQLGTPKATEIATLTPVIVSLAQAVDAAEKATKAAAKAEAEYRDRISDTIAFVEEALTFETLRAEALKKGAKLEAELTAAIDNGKISLEKKLFLMREQLALQSALNEETKISAALSRMSPNVVRSMGGRSITDPKATVQPNPMFDMGKFFSGMNSTGGPAAGMQQWMKNLKGAESGLDKFFKGVEGTFKGIGEAIKKNFDPKQFITGVAVNLASSFASKALSNLGELFFGGDKAREEAKKWKQALSDMLKAIDATDAERMASEANQRVRAFAEQGGLQIFTDTLDETLQELDRIIKESEQILGTSGRGLSGRERSTATNRQRAADDTRRLAIAEKERLDRDLAERKNRATEDLGIRALAARGMQAEAEAARMLAQQRREIDEAAKAGLDAVTLVQLAYVHELEREAAAKQKAADTVAFNVSINERWARIQGDNIELLRIRIRKELDAAQEMVRAGTITQDMFERLAEVLGVELAQAINAAALEAVRAAEAFENAKQSLKGQITLAELAHAGDEKAMARFRANQQANDWIREAYELGLPKHELQAILERIQKWLDEELKRIDAGADAAAGALATGGAIDQATEVARGVSAISATQAIRLVDIARSQLAVQQDIRGLLANGYSTTRMDSGVPVQRGPSVSLGDVTVTVEFNAPVTTQDPNQLAAMIANTVNRMLADEMHRRLRLSGVVTVQ